MNKLPIDGKIESAIVRSGMRALICKTHDRELALLVDPITVDNNRARNGGSRYYCAAWLDLPQVSDCVIAERR